MSTFDLCLYFFGGFCVGYAITDLIQEVWSRR